MPKETRFTPDYLGDWAEARRLAAMVRDFWRLKGYEVPVSVIRNARLDIYEVRSELRNGLPLHEHRSAIACT